MKTSNNAIAGRLHSLDALRGFDMFFIMGGAGLLSGLAKWFPCGFAEAIARQMGHVSWNGLTHHDTIFPLFLFIAGISFPFSLAKQRQNGRTETAIHTKIIRRGLLLVLLGIVYNGLLDFSFSDLRYPSVLGRIGLAWMFAALIFVHTRWQTRAWITTILLVGYWLLIGFVPAPDANGAEIFSQQGSLVGYVDRMLMPNHILNDNFDPEGLLSTLPAVGTALLGMFTGEWVKSERSALNGNRKVLGLVVAGLLLLAVGLLWSTVFPVNKKLWTSSFVLVVGACSVLIFALFYYVIDVLGWRRWAFFFVVIGLNSITIYLAQSFIDFGYTTDQFFEGALSFLPESAEPFFWHAGYVAVCWLFLYFLYRKRFFLKI